MPSPPSEEPQRPSQGAPTDRHAARVDADGETMHSEPPVPTAKVEGPPRRPAPTREPAGSDGAPGSDPDATPKGEGGNASGALARLQSGGSARGRSGQRATVEPEIGRFGPYALVKEIGRGGMGVVYKARDEKLRRDVALKVMLQAGVASEQEQRRFIREAEACAALKHPNIVQVHDIGEHEGSFYFTMDFVVGASLRDWIRAADRATDDVVRILAKIADAVHFAHQHGIIHRDLKPQNVMMDAAAEPHIMDFGLAKRVGGELEDPDAAGSATVAGSVMGTPHYMPPEQARGDIAEIDTRTDTYALGVIAYELLGGALPFHARSFPELLDRIENEEPKPLRALRPELSWELETVVLKALSKEKLRRYQSAADLADDLRRYLAREPIRARPATLAYRGWKFFQRNRVPALAGAIALTALLASGAAVAETWRAERSAVRAKYAKRIAAAENAYARAEKQRELAADAPQDRSRLEALLGYLDTMRNEAAEAVSIDREGARAAELQGLAGIARAEVLKALEKIRELEAEEEARRGRIADAEGHMRAVERALGALTPEGIAALDEGALARESAMLTGPGGARERLLQASGLVRGDPRVAALMARTDGIAAALAARIGAFARRKGRDEALAEGTARLEEARARAASVTAGADERADDAVARSFEEAAKSFELALRLDPDSPAASDGLAAATLLDGEHALAGRRFTIARRLARRAEPLSPTRSATLLAAIDAAETAETRFAQDFAAARRARIEGSLERALQGFRSAVDQAPRRRDVLALLRLSEAEAAERRAVAAEKTERRALLEEALAPALEAEALAREVEALANALPPADADDVARTSRRIRGDLARGLLATARTDAAARRFDDAEAAVARARALVPDDPDGSLVAAEIRAARALPEGMMLVPGGVFPMGPRGASKDVVVPAFLFGEREVTNAEFADFVAAGAYADARLFPAEAAPHLARLVDATGRPGPAAWKGGRPIEGTEALPVTGISWYEARAYAAWRRMRLPTEVEWEKAATWDATAGEKLHTRWASGGSGAEAGLLPWDLWRPYFRRRAPKTAEAAAFTAPDGRPVADVAPSGARDVYGNVREWVADTDGDLAAVRGGGFGLDVEERQRPTRRFLAPKDLRVETIGVRLAAEAAR